MAKLLETFEKYIIYITVALLPVFVLLIFPSPLITSKLALIGVGVLLAVSVFIIKSIISGQVVFSCRKFDFSVLILMLVYITSTLLTKVNKIEAFFLPGVTAFVFFGGILYFLINQFNKKGKEGIVSSYIVSSLLLSISIAATEIGFFSKIAFLPAAIKDPAFNPLGGNVSSIVYLAIAVPVLTGLIFKYKDIAGRLFWGVAGVLIFMGLVISIKNSLPGSLHSLKFIGLDTSWEIAVDTLKQFPVWGIGPANYLTAFNKFKPLSFNQNSDLWQVKFTGARNTYLTMITETGLAGVLALILIFVAIYKIYKKHDENLWEKISLGVLLASFAVFPLSSIFIILMFIFLAINSDSENKNFKLAETRASVVASTFPLVLGIVMASFFASRWFMAEYKFKKGLEAAAQNNAQETFKNLEKAIALNPYVDRYHASFAQIDIALASSLASKKDVTDEEKKTISQLIEHAINEGKITVNLNPTRSDNWEILARIYRNIMPFAQGADNFTIQTFTQGIALNPVDPKLRIALGGTYFALGRQDEAIEAFKMAVLAKPDLANAHYNLAIAYREKKEFKKATEEMNTVLSLVGKNSADYETAMKELKNIQELTPPEPVEESTIKPPLELPQDSNPPIQQ